MIQARLESEFPKSSRDALVVDWGIGVEPVRPWVHVQVQDFRHVRTFEQNLSAPGKAAEQIQFCLVQLKQFSVPGAVERRVRQQELRRTTLDDGAEQVRRRKVFDGLCRE